MTLRAKRLSWCEKKNFKSPKPTDLSEFSQPSCMGHIQILSHPPHANQADGTATHRPFSPLPPAAPQFSFPLPIVEQHHGKLSRSWRRGGQGRVGDMINSNLLSLWPWVTSKKLPSASGPPVLLEKLFSASLVKVVLYELATSWSWCVLLQVIVWKVCFPSKLLRSGDVSNEMARKRKKVKISELCKPRISMKDGFSPINEERDKNSKTWGKNLLAGSVALCVQLLGKSQAEHMGQDPISCSRPDRLLGESSCSDNVLV